MCQVKSPEKILYSLTQLESVILQGPESDMVGYFRAMDRIQQAISFLLRQIEIANLEQSRLTSVTDKLDTRPSSDRTISDSDNSNGVSSAYQTVLVKAKDLLDISFSKLEECFKETLRSRFVFIL